MLCDLVLFQCPLESVTQVTRTLVTQVAPLTQVTPLKLVTPYTRRPFPEWRCAGANAQPPAIATLEKPTSTHQHQCSPSMATSTTVTVTSTASLYQENLRHQPARRVVGFGAWAQDLLLSWIRWLWHVMAAYGTAHRHTHTHDPTTPVPLDLTGKAAECTVAVMWGWRTIPEAKRFHCCRDEASKSEFLSLILGATKFRSAQTCVVYTPQISHLQEAASGSAVVD